MPDFLKLEDGKEVVVELTGETPWREEVHWLNNKNELCKGNSCLECGAGKKARVRYTVDCQLEGAKKVVTFPALAWEGFRNEQGWEKPPAGLVVGIIVQGKGDKRRYVFRLVSIPGPVGPAQALGNRAVVHAAVVSLRQVAASLEGLVTQRPGGA